MADSTATATTATTANTANTPTTPRGAHSGRGRSNRNRSGSQNSPENNRQDTGAKASRGQRGGRGRGRGRGQSRDPAASARTIPVQTPADGSSGRPPGGGFGARLTEAASKSEGDSKAPQSQGEGVETAVEEAEVCFICASPIEHVSIAPCNHQTCHICSLRLRALYKTRACAHCRVSLAPSHSPNI